MGVKLEHANGNVKASSSSSNKLEFPTWYNGNAKAEQRRQQHAYLYRSASEPGVRRQQQQQQQSRKRLPSIAIDIAVDGAMHDAGFSDLTVGGISAEKKRDLARREAGEWSREVDGLQFESPAAVLRDVSRDPTEISQRNAAVARGRLVNKGKVLHSLVTHPCGQRHPRSHPMSGMSQATITGTGRKNKGKNKNKGKSGKNINRPAHIDALGTGTTTKAAAMLAEVVRPYDMMGGAISGGMPPMPAKPNPAIPTIKMRTSISSSVMQYEIHAPETLSHTLWTMGGERNGALRPIGS